MTRDAGSKNPLSFRAEGEESPKLFRDTLIFEALNFEGLSQYATCQSSPKVTGLHRLRRRVG
jgi:hypothetical protein